MQQIELKPCPFCGRVDTPIIWSTRSTGLINWRVSCDMAGDKTGCGGSCGARKTRAEAIEAWNRRANDEQT